MGLLTNHEGEPVTFFLGGAFAPQYFGAIALEPLFDLGGIGIPRWRRRHGNRFDGLAGQRPTDTTGVLAMTGGAGGGVGLAPR